MLVVAGSAFIFGHTPGSHVFHITEGRLTLVFIGILKIISLANIRQVLTADFLTRYGRLLTQNTLNRVLQTSLIS
jgi:hypothetical protein